MTRDRGLSDPTRTNRPLGWDGLAGRVGYGALFVLGVPAVLVMLATEVQVPWPAPHQPVLGWLLAALGTATCLAGLWGILRHGRGLPMNAFPPERLVTGGVFALVPHPIYTGFCLAGAGITLAQGSAAGWVSTLVAVLGALGLVLGHERAHLLRRFGTLPRTVVGRLGRRLSRTLGLPRLWAAVLRGTERLANSWSAARIGPLRVMNHLVFSGLAGAVGAAGVVLVAGARHAAVTSALMLAGAVGAALVGQLLVGSSNRLSRPFGYFGALTAIILLGGAWTLIHPQDAVVLAAFALLAPWTQAIGRLRCIVQGCCHGAPAPAASGIVVTNPHSRVCALADLAGVPIYPTALYSLLGNLVLGPMLLLAWAAGAPLTLVMGGYLIGAGTIRFIEEAYRGEPLTPQVAGLRLYQWFAVAMFVCGVGVLWVPSVPAPAILPDAWAQALVVGLVFFVVCGAAMSVDVPGSSVRFSRLSG